jgi:hypothetical protein
MKKYYLNFLLASALTLSFSACQKDAEKPITKSEKKIAAVSNVVFPLDANEMSTNILPKKNKLPDAALELIQIDEDASVKVINEVCDEYVKQTKKLDISKVEEGVFGKQIVNDDFTVFFSRRFGSSGEGFLKLNNGPKGWWTHWNYMPYTESEYPNVLFASDASGRPLNEFDLAFDEDLTMFGFEVAPNATGKDIKIYLTFHQFEEYRDPPLFFVYQTVSSPSGARLIAVKSDAPFRRVTMGVSTQDIEPGIAIANIRYKLAK